VLFVGRHEERKGLGVLLEAVTRLHPDTALTVWVAGEGPDTDGLRRRHPPSTRVQWLGRIDDAELASRLAGAHALCAPALRGESFGVVLLEAMAARAAVVASDLAGYAAVVGGHGLLVAPGDPDALARALETVAGDAARGTGWCGPGALNAAFAHASQWSMANVAQRYIAVYERVLAGTRPEA
jgi:phosphatidylinositol alpha-mannosyltransferase